MTEATAHRHRIEPGGDSLGRAEMPQGVKVGRQPSPPWLPAL